MHSRHRPLLTTLALIASCSTSQPNEPVVLTHGRDTVRAAAVMSSSVIDLARWPRDPLVIRSAEVRGDSLYIAAEHGGGCNDHRYGLVIGPTWMESIPVQVDAYVAHEANGDPCDALLRPSFAFSLLPLREAYRHAYRSASGTVTLNLHPGRIAVDYRF